MSARNNMEEERLFVAAEEIFRSIENSIEAMLYKLGIKRIAYPGRKNEFTGRLALQFLIRDDLLRRNIITKGDFDSYLAYAAKLHRAGYHYGHFEDKELEQALEYVENLLARAGSL